MQPIPKASARCTGCVAALIAAAFAPPALATNGMNLEAYGPVAMGTGGASFAYDNGTAAVMNNPATLALMPGPSRVDLAAGVLGPDVNSRVPGAHAESGGDSYFMPALGYARRAGKLVYGLGIFGQGGMGTEYGRNTFLSAGTGQEARTEVAVGRLILPLAYSASERLSFGATLDFVWAGMDLRMPMPTQAMGVLATPGNGFGSMSGSLMAGLGPALPSATAGYFDFSNSDDFSGKAMGTGWAGKLGFLWRASPVLAVGGTYHFKTRIDDLETGDSGATLALYNGSNPLMAMRGKITVRDFQWPETYGLGVSWQATPQWQFVADWKRLNWSEVMSNFRMSFSAAGAGNLDVSLVQNWEDQDILLLGAAYRHSDALTLRVGINHADNPVPSRYVNPLFPAIVETHYTFGAGYQLSKAASVDFAPSYAPAVEVTGSGALNNGIDISHSQLSWQAMYSHRF